MNAKTLRIVCETESCTNYMVLAADDAIEPPTHWLCSACVDHMDNLMIDDLARREQMRADLQGVK